MLGKCRLLFGEARTSFLSNGMANQQEIHICYKIILPCGGVPIVDSLVRSAVERCLVWCAPTIFNYRTPRRRGENGDHRCVIVAA